MVINNHHYLTRNYRYITHAHVDSFARARGVSRERRLAAIFKK